MEKFSDWVWEIATGALLMVVGWLASWKRNTDKEISDLKLHVSEHYVKKTDLEKLEEKIGEKFKEVTDGQGQILDVLLSQKIGSLRRR